MIDNFGHHPITLLPHPGAAAGALGSKAHLAAVKTACKAVERTHGVLKLACRTEIAVVPDTPDFFDGSSGLAAARTLSWEVMEATPRLQWVILTRLPENISKFLPTTWICKGFRNVCVGVVVDGEIGFSEKLQALRKAPLQSRMILVTPSAKLIDLRGQLEGISWVVLAGPLESSGEAARLAAVCQEQHVAFHFHRTDRDPAAVDPATKGEEPPLWLEHPFSTDIQLLRPTLSGLDSRPPPPLETTAQQAAIVTSIEPVIENMSEIPTTTENITTNQTTEIHGEGDIPPESPPDAISCPMEVAMPEETPNPVVSTDRSEFDKHDEVIRRDLHLFVAVGRSLMEIRDRELWRVGGHSSWAAYCRSVGGLTKTHANRLINAAETTAHLGKVTPAGDTSPAITPATEWQIRPLSRLKSPEQQVTAWSLAVEQAGGQPTANQVVDVVAELMADDPSSLKPTPVTGRKAILLDRFAQLRAAISANEPADRIEELLTELEILLKLR